ncbi:hypothetical protein [Salinispira pacifica]
MFELRPRLYRTSPDRLVIRFSRWFRSLFGAVAGLLLWGMIGSGVYSPVIIILIAICAGAGLYNDRWILDRSRRVAEYHLGILPIYRRVVLPFDSIVRLEHREFGRGSLIGRRRARFEREQEPDEEYPQRKWKVQRALSRIAVVTVDGRRYGMELTAYEPAGSPGTTAEEIGGFLGKEIIRIS